ncbi:MAG: glycosyltransferase [Candidatus Coatesbacteria bacterium]|nr:glycosyltransferase [Candidatus Coatesbacteria bacterium]
MPHPELSVVICSYRCREVLGDCLASILTAGGLDEVEVIVVDNASGDGTAEVARSFPGVRVLVNEANLGFSRANNRGLRLARGRFRMILNPDMLVLDGALAELVRFMDDHPDCGACGGRGFSPAGEEQPQFTRAVPTPLVALFHFLRLDRLFPGSRLFGRYNYTWADREQVLEVEALSGSCMLTRPAALEEVGLLDERFPLYAEDLDWCLRFRRAGWKVNYVPTARFIHHHGRSSGKNLVWARKQFFLTMRQFYNKHLRAEYNALVNLLVDAGILAGLGLGLLRAYLRCR